MSETQEQVSAPEAQPQVNFTQDQYDSLVQTNSQFEAQIAELTDKLRVAEENKQRANQESAERRITIKDQQKALEAAMAENRQMWVNDYTRRACDEAGIPLEIASQWIQERVQIEDYTNGPRVLEQLSEMAGQFAEKYPGTVTKQAKPDPWGTPETDEDGQPVHDVQKLLEQAMEDENAGREPPGHFEKMWQQHGGDELMEQGVFR